MTWKELLAEKRVETHTTSKQELDDLRVAYEAVLLLGKMAVACAGYRVKGQGAHQTTFAAAS